MLKNYRNITFFTGATIGKDVAYEIAVRELSAYLASECNVTAIYGGSNVGLMGVLADSFIQANANVIGVMPKYLVDKELAHENLHELIIVDGMHQRKQKMMDLGDAFVALPGGCGTLEELFEVLTWQQLGIHAKPVILYDVKNFWKPLLYFIETLVSAGFVQEEYYKSLIIAMTPKELVELLAVWEAPSSRWGK